MYVPKTCLCLMTHCSDFDKANEILFRLGIIYKQQGKYQESLECFDRILRNPPSPLAHADIWFQIGHVYEQQKDHAHAKDAYERVVADNPHHAKVLQQLGWLYHQDGSTFQNQDLAITYLTKSLEADPSDAQSWYLLGRAYMAGQKYNKAYEAYQQAVYRDGRNPTFWCSIGVLYFQINQYRDALDAYSRAIRINPYISEVWFDLGSLYESCNNQISDAIDAYARASELDPGNPIISQRLQLLRNAQQTGSTLPAAPGPQDVHPTAYANAVGPPVTMPGSNPPPVLNYSGGPTPRSIFTRSETRDGVEGGMALPSPHSQHAPPPFRGGPPPPVVLDDARRVPNHTPLAPMEVTRMPMHDGYPPREHSGSRGSGAHQSLLLHHPQPAPQPAPEHHTSRDPAYYRSHTRRPTPTPSPPPSQRQMRGPPEPVPYGYPPAGTNGSGQSARPPMPPSSTSQRSPRVYTSVPHYEPAASPPPPESWERRDRERTRPRRDSERGNGGLPPAPHGYSHTSHSHSQSRGVPSPIATSPYDAHPSSRRNTVTSPPPAPAPGGRPVSPVPPPSRHHSMSERSPITTTGPGSGPAPGPGSQRWHPPGRYEHEPEPSPHSRSGRTPPSPIVTQAPQTSSRRYDPIGRSERMDRDRFDRGYERERMDRSLDRAEYDRDAERDRYEGRHATSPEVYRSTSSTSVNTRTPVLPPPSASTSSGGSGPEYANPYPPPVPETTRRRGRGRDKDADAMTMRGPSTPVPPSAPPQTSTFSAVSGPVNPPADSAKDKRKRRTVPSRRVKDSSDSNAGSRAASQTPTFKVAMSAPSAIKTPPSPEPVSSVSASGSSGRSGRPSPIAGLSSAGSSMPRRVVDEDYDEGVVEHKVNPGQAGGAGAVSPTVSVGGRKRIVSPPPAASHRSSVSSSGSRHSPQNVTSASGSLKRPLSPGLVDSVDSKRSRIEILNRAPMGRNVSPTSGGRRTPPSASRPSPVPFHTQPIRSLDDRMQGGDREMRIHDRSPTTSTNTTGIPSTLTLPPPPSAVPPSAVVSLPPIATLQNVSSPSSTGGPPSPTTESDRMQVDMGLGGHGPSHSRSATPTTHAAPPVLMSSGGSRSKIVDMMNPTSRDSGPGSSGPGPRRSSSGTGHSVSPTNSQSQGNATRSPPKDKSASPRS